MTDGDGQALAATVARHDALNPWCSFIVGPPEQESWISIADLVDDDTVIAGWIADLRTRVTQGRGDVAGSYLSSWLGGLLVGSLAAVVVAEGVGWSLAPESLAIRRHPDGWFDGCAVRPQALRPFDADEAVALLTPLFAQVRRHAAFGRVGMWGSVADAIADRAVRRADHEGGDVDQAWAGAMELIAAIAARQPLLRSRPRLEGGTVVASTCCLYFKISGGDGYCSTCPKLRVATS